MTDAAADCGKPVLGSNLIPFISQKKIIYCLLTSNHFRLVTQLLPKKIRWLSDILVDHS